MIRLRQHVPMFVNDGEGGWTHHAPDLASLLALPDVQRYARDIEPIERRGTVTGWINGERKDVSVIFTAPDAQRFHQWSRSDNHLMVEHNGGDRFWVVGYLSADHPDELAALPVWQETETARRRREAWNRGEHEPQPAMYRCAEHGVANASCCLRTETPRVVAATP